MSRTERESRASPARFWTSIAISPCLLRSIPSGNLPAASARRRRGSEPPYGSNWSKSVEFVYIPAHNEPKPSRSDPLLRPRPPRRRGLRQLELELELGLERRRWRQHLAD